MADFLYVGYDIEYIVMFYGGTGCVIRFSSFVFCMRSVNTKSGNFSVATCGHRSFFVHAFRGNDRPNCCLLGNNGRPMYCRERKNCCFMFVVRSLYVWWSGH